MTALMCIGGPWDGKAVAPPNNSADTFIIAIADSVWLKPAIMDSMDAPPASVVPARQEAVYKRKTITFVGQGYQTRIEAFVYYGRDTQDRPRGWHA